MFLSSTLSRMPGDRQEHVVVVRPSARHRCRRRHRRAAGRGCDRAGRGSGVPDGGCRRSRRHGRSGGSGRAGGSGHRPGSDRSDGSARRPGSGRAGGSGRPDSDLAARSGGPAGRARAARRRRRAMRRSSRRPTRSTAARPAPASRRRTLPAGCRRDGSPSGARVLAAVIQLPLPAAPRLRAHRHGHPGWRR